MLFQEVLTVSHYACVLLSFSIQYFVLTNFFWMFVEGNVIQLKILTKVLVKIKF